MKNGVGIDHKSDSEVPRSRFFFFFLLLLTNFTKMLSIYEAEPLPSAPSCLFIGNEGRRLNSSSPRRAGYFTPKLSSGPKGLKMPPNDPFTLLFVGSSGFGIIKQGGVELIINVS